MRSKVVSSILIFAGSMSAASIQTEIADEATVAAVTVGCDSIVVDMDPVEIITVEELGTDSVISAPVEVTDIDSFMLEPRKAESIYRYPYSMTFSKGDWKRMWTNTCVLTGAYVATLLVLECLPPDATAWNRAEIRNVPLFKRWYNHVIKKGPEWDHDNPVFNYVLHPYAGAAYFMACRSTGFNFWQSFLYSTAISTVGWEFGIEAFMERPSVQDLFITPCVGSVIGEMFYRVKRGIVANDYELGGSKVLGNVVAFLVDPVNEVVDLFRGRNTAPATGVEVVTQFSASSVSLLVKF